MFKTIANIAALSSGFRHINIPWRSSHSLLHSAKKVECAWRDKTGRLKNLNGTSKWRDNDGIWTLFTFNYCISTFILLRSCFSTFISTYRISTFISTYRIGTFIFLNRWGINAGCGGPDLAWQLVRCSWLQQFISCLSL